jgi:hypothetical protein
MTSAICFFVLHQDGGRGDDLQNASVFELPHRIAGDVVCADGVPTRADGIEDDQLVKVERRHFQERQLLVREGRVRVVEEVVGSHQVPMRVLPPGGTIPWLVRQNGHHASSRCIQIVADSPQTLQAPSAPSRVETSLPFRFTIVSKRENRTLE